MTRKDVDVTNVRPADPIIHGIFIENDKQLVNLW